MYDTYDSGLTGGEIFFIVLGAVVGLVIWWFLIQTAVKSGVRSALQDRDYAREDREKRQAEAEARRARQEAAGLRMAQGQTKRRRESAGE